MAKRSKREKTDTPKKPRGRPRSQPLPGLEDARIKPLEDLAAAYADVRDRRIELNREESELKQHAIKLMHRHDKTIYRRDGIEIRLVEGDEDVKVKVKKAGDDTESNGGGDGEPVDAEEAGADA